MNNNYGFLQTNYTLSMNILKRAAFLCFLIFTIVTADDKDFFTSNRNNFNSVPSFSNGNSFKTSSDEYSIDSSSSENSSNNQTSSSSSSSSNLSNFQQISTASSLTELSTDSSGLISSELNSFSRSSSQANISTGSTSSSITSSEKTSNSVLFDASTSDRVTKVSDGNLNNNATTSVATNSSAEKEDVILPAEDETPISYTKTIFRQTLVWLNDTYTLSILIPVVAGVVFASTIIITVATCKCIRRRIYRRRLRRKILPESVKNMRPSDRARLLAETSDDEF